MTPSGVERAERMHRESAAELHGERARDHRERRRQRGQARTAHDLRRARHDLEHSRSGSQRVAPPTLSRVTTYGLTSAEAARRLEERPAHPAASSLTYRAIVRRNLLTLFNFVLAACAVALIATGQLADLLFAGVLVVNSGIGIVQEVRAKRALDRLALLAAPRARVLRDGAEREVGVDDVVVGDADRRCARATRSWPTAACSRRAACRSTSRSSPASRIRTPGAPATACSRDRSASRAAASTRPSAWAPTPTPTSSRASRARTGASSRRCSSRSTACCA